MNKHLPMPVKRRPRACGLTLIELVVGMAIASILMIAISSAMLLASRALPSKTSLASQTLDATRALDLALDELRFATYISQRSDKLVQFAIPDRTGDGRPEVIKYEWSGTPGDPLVRTFNGAASNVLPGVNSFAFTWDTTSFVETHPGPPTEGSETLLASYESTTSISSSTIRSNRWFAQYFKPSFASNVVSWKITRVLFRARQVGTVSGTTAVSIQPANASRYPSGTIIDQKNVSESSLDDEYGWVQVTFNNAGGLTPGAAMCLTLSSSDTSGDALEFQFRGGGVPAASGGLIEGDPAWKSFAGDKAMRYAVYGTVSTHTPRQVNRTLITGVQVAATTTAEPQNHLQSAAGLLNKPESLLGYWEADFSADPTTFDRNADGLNDFTTPAPFNSGSLSGGKWTGDQMLTSAPSRRFTGFTVIETRLEDIDKDGKGVGMVFYVDRTAINCGVIELELSRSNDTKQKLKIITRDVLLLPSTLANTDVPIGNTSINFYVNPGNRTFVVTVNGLWLGEYSYGIINLVTQGVVQLYRNDGDAGARIDHVRIREGGTPQ